MSSITNGKSLQPLSGGAPKQIVLLLHGYGSNGEDLISLGAQWQAGFPDALFLAPNAPQPCSMGFGYQWWPLATLSPAAMAAGAPGGCMSQTPENGQFPRSHSRAWRR